MVRRSMLRAIAVCALALFSGSTVRAQTACATSGASLTSFSPMDSLILNSSASSFNIKLFNGVTGCPTEYRVSHFSDFHDASWTPYSATPSTVIQRSWFPTIANGTTKLTLYFQVRAKNPRGGLPISISGGTQPMYFVSPVLSHSIRLQYFG